MAKRLTRQDAVNVVQSLGLPQQFLQLARGERPDGILSMLGTAGEFYLASASEQGVFAEREIIPLWDDGSFYEVVAWDRTSCKFVVFDVEEEFDYDSLPRYNFQQVLLDVFIRAWEAELPEDQFLSLARDLGFTAAAEVIRAYESTELSTAEQHETWRKNLLRRLGG